MSRIRRTLTGATCAALALIGACGDSQPSTPPAEPERATSPHASATPQAADAWQADLNRGAAEMGLFEFERAERTFADLRARRPDDVDAERNLAIAVLNQTADGAQERALALFEAILARHPDDTRARYCAGLAELFLGRPESAAARFRAVVAEDPSDAYAAFYLGQCLEFANRYADALAEYERSASLDPYLRSPLLGAQRCLARLGREEDAASSLEAFTALADTPRSRLAEFKYTRMGPKAEAFAGPRTVPARRERSGELFEEIAVRVEGADDVRWSSGSARPNLTVADIDGDDVLDLFAAAAFADGSNAVLLAMPSEDNVRYRLVRDHPLASIRDVRCALWGDYDNDGITDVYLCRKGPNVLMRGEVSGDGQRAYRDVTASTRTAGGDLDTVDGAFADLDHDGDLDLYLANANGPNELLNNNLDGTFRALGAERGIAGDGRPTRAVLVSDLDGDRDADILLVHAAPPHELFLNDRMWRYRAATDARSLLDSSIATALAADLSADGRESIVTVSPEGALTRWTRDGDGWRAARATDALPLGVADDRGLAVADVRGEGSTAVIARTAKGFTVTDLGGSTASVPAPARGTRVLAWTPYLRTLEGPSLAILTDEGPALLDPGAARGGFATVEFSGRVDPSQSMRSNASGIGTAYAARVGTSWSAGSTFRADSGPGQSLQPVAFGVSDSAVLDFLALDWSDGVRQTELGLPQDARTRVVETQRQISSCPVIFASVADGTFAFVTDCLGVGGLGYLVAPGEYAEPRPWERVILPESLALAPRDGLVEIRLGEPMEEACYLDAARLVAYDLPPGWSMTIDERMGIGAPSPTGEPVYFRTSLAPTAARDGRGVDVLAAVLAPDGAAAEVVDVDPRFIGRLRTPQTIELEFARPLDELPGTPTLLAHGWIEYPYCQTNFAAWQAGATFDAPDLWARGRDGVWSQVYGQWGYPAGMPREMSLPLVGLPAGTTALRLSTTNEIYWDAFRVVGAEPCPAAERYDCPLREATLSACGFPVRVRQPQKRPEYDYAVRLPLWDVRAQPGWYTRFGSCIELVEATDDAVAIFGAGEEVQLRYAPPPPLRERWSRRFVLETDGWCKDMDLFTGEGETLAPIPSRGTGDSGREDLHRRFNVRWRDGS